MFKNLLGFITGIQDKSKQKTQAIQNFKSERKFAAGGGVSPLPDTPNPAPPLQQIPLFKKLIDMVARPKTAQAAPIISPLASSTPKPTSRPPLPTATPTPMPVRTIQPTATPDIPRTYYTHRNSKIEPRLWDAIQEASPSGDVELNDFMKKMAMALATQESSGGYNVVGDEGKSHGPYHIQRANVPVADRYDPKKSTDLVFKEMLHNILKNGVPKERSLRTWNWHSGYKNNGPRYNVDIPQMATTSSFYRGQ